jgi:hypothetical protein
LEDSPSTFVPGSPSVEPIPESSPWKPPSTRDPSPASTLDSVWSNEYISRPAIPDFIDWVQNDYGPLPNLLRERLSQSSAMAAREGGQGFTPEQLSQLQGLMAAVNPEPSPTSYGAAIRAFAGQLDGGAQPADVAGAMKRFVDHVEAGKTVAKAWEARGAEVDPAERQAAALAATLSSAVRQGVAAGMRAAGPSRARGGASAGRGAGRKCSRCGRTSHVASACFAKTHVDTGKTLG